MSLALLSAYIMSVLMLLLTPGPVVDLVTGTAAQHEFRKAFATVIGTNGASLVLIALAALMLAGVVSLSPLFLYLLGAAGSLYIGWTAVTSLRGLSAKENRAAKATAGDRGRACQRVSNGNFKSQRYSFLRFFFPAIYCRDP